MIESDLKLLTKIKNKKRKGFKDLYIKYRISLIKYAESYIYDVQTSEDIVEDLFIYIWENSEKIIIRTSLESYLYTAVRNRCLTSLNKLNITTEYNEASSNIADESSYSEDNIYSTYNQDQSISEKLKTLPPQMRQVVEMKYIEGKRRKEIAKELNISIETVKTQLSRGRQRLRK